MSTQAAKLKNGEEAQGGGPTFQLPGPIQRLADYPRQLRQFLHEVRVEMRQVAWPTWNDVYATTGVVIATVFFFGLFLFLVDLGVSHFIERVFKFFKL